MLRIHILNVQQGDSIIVEFVAGNERHFGVIDSNRPGGWSSKGLEKLEELGAQHLSFVCLTHPDKDHYSGLYDILNRYKNSLDTFFVCPLGDIVGNPQRLKKLAQQYRNIAKGQDSPEITQKANEFVQILKLAHENFLPNRWQEVSGEWNRLAPKGFHAVDIHSILPPSKAKGHYFERIDKESTVIEGDVENNSLSIALHVAYGGRSVVLGGDGSKANWANHRRWQEKAGKEIKSNIVKLPHHGSSRDFDEDTRKNLFDLDGKAFGIVSANGKSHPSEEVLDWMLRRDVSVFCTNLHRRWRTGVHDLIGQGSLDPTLVRWINEAGAEDLERVFVCKGDICVSIDALGTITVDTEHANLCGCDASSSALFR